MAVKKIDAKSKTAKKKVASKGKNVSEKKPKSKAAKPAFGGYAISFAGRKETVEKVFGSEPITPSQMTKKIWEFIKAKELSNR